MAQRGRPPKVPRRRRKGKLNGENLNLKVPEITGYETRWANDQKNRIYQLTQLDDWDFVTAEEIADPNNPDKPLVGEKTHNPNAEGSSRIRALVDKDKDGPVYAFLLKKRREFVEADKREKSEAKAAKLKDIKEGRASPMEKQYGEVRIERA